ncbi:hypothetical protein, partial [Treponema primitia]|uniref:hypothetical protein n=1 Tax=Treponema primitia TaxID=88058 RepID=UPI0018E16F1C
MILAAFFLALGACELPVVPDKPAGNLTISTGSRARAISDETAKSFRYEFDFSGPGGKFHQEKPQAGTTRVTLSVSLGDWTITARAYTNPGNILAGTGTITHTVVAGTNSVTIHMDISDDYAAYIAAHTAKEITEFTLAGVSGNISETDDANGTITLTVPYGTNLTNITASVTHTGASISPDPTETRSYASPAAYTVSASDGSVRIYTVTVTAAAIDAKAITAFSLTSPVKATGIVHETA